MSKIYSNSTKLERKKSLFEEGIEYVKARSKRKGECPMNLKTARNYNPGTDPSSLSLQKEPTLLTP